MLRSYDARELDLYLTGGTSVITSTQETTQPWQNDHEYLLMSHITFRYHCIHVSLLHYNTFLEYSFCFSVTLT